MPTAGAAADERQTPAPRAGGGAFCVFVPNGAKAGTDGGKPTSRGLPPAGRQNRYTYRPSAWSRQAPATPWRGRRPPPSALYHSRGPSARGAPAAIDRDARLWYNGRVPGAASWPSGQRMRRFARMGAHTRGRRARACGRAPDGLRGGGIAGRKEAAMDTIYLYALNVSALTRTAPCGRRWPAPTAARAWRRSSAWTTAAARWGRNWRCTRRSPRHLKGYAPPADYMRLPGGKPVLRDGEGWHISLAHAGDWAVCALHRAPVGVDVERKCRASANPRARMGGRGELSELTGAGLAGGFRTLCAGETEIFRLGARVACLARGEVGDCLLCAATDAPAALHIEDRRPRRAGVTAGNLTSAPLYKCRLPAMPTSRYNIGRNALKGTASASPFPKRAGAGASPVEGRGGDRPGAAGRTPHASRPRRVRPLQRRRVFARRERALCANLGGTAMTSSQTGDGE